jgi:hypothetical protein
MINAGRIRAAGMTVASFPIVSGENPDFYPFFHQSAGLSHSGPGGEVRLFSGPGDTVPKMLLMESGSGKGWRFLQRK